MTMMKAAVIYEPGGPEVLKLENRPIPTAGDGEAKRLEERSPSGLQHFGDGAEQGIRP
jgi:hypothetical protein